MWRLSRRPPHPCTASLSLFYNDQFGSGAQDHSLRAGLGVTFQARRRRGPETLGLVMYPRGKRRIMTLKSSGASVYPIAGYR